MRFFSLEGKLAILLVVAAAAGAATVYVAHRYLPGELLPWSLSAILLVPLLGLLAHALAQPISGLIRAMSGAVASFRDGDFSFSIHTGRRDEIGDLVDAHNELGTVLRDERQSLFQRELLLHTVVQNTPNALVLVDAADHVVYGNTSARQLLNTGRKLEGLTFEAVLSECPAAMRDAVREARDGIFSVMLEGLEEAFHLAQRSFQLNGQPHRLYLIRRLTRELSRQEVATWKKVIRVISHELNNSLAPIQSLAHSGRELAERGDTERLKRVFEIIEQRARHLDSFIGGYAAFAKLPTPRLEAMVWRDFLAKLGEHYPYVLAAEPPGEVAWFDPAQLSQVLINLLKNAHESGSAPGDVALEVATQGGEWRVSVRDRGTGMSEQVLANALVPFYSTKRSGTGLGLALAREIVDAHGGRLALANRDGGGLSVDLWLPRGAREA
jgi:two-component system, NtrC family, nitrogen regulation sensor histidine kinase NtrY